MNYAAIKPRDIANGTGVRTALFVSGCTHRCKGCFNEIAWDFNYGEPFTEEVENSIIDGLKDDYMDGLSLLGGEPFEPQNQRALVNFLKKVKNAYPEKTVWCYTGYLFEELLTPGGKGNCEVSREMMSYIDVLVDGEFKQELKNLNLRFRGSSNQRIIDVNKSLKSGQTILWDGAMTNKESFNQW